MQASKKSKQDHNISIFASRHTGELEREFSRPSLAKENKDGMVPYSMSIMTSPYGDFLDMEFPATAIT
jgi:hypothetical protein